MKTTCFFDLDGTLMLNPFGSAVWPVVTRELASATGLSPKALLHAISAENARRQHDQPNHPLTMDWDDIVQTVAQSHNARLSVRIIDLVESNCLAPHIAVLDNAPDMLHELKQAGYRLVVASKGLSKYQNPVMKALGLYDLFDDFLMPDLTGYLKTDSGFFARYTSASDPGLLIHIGDFYVDDVLAPKRAGLRSILRAPIQELAAYAPHKRPKHLYEYRNRIETFPENEPGILPDAVVIHLSELLEVILRLERSS